MGKWLRKQTLTLTSTRLYKNYHIFTVWLDWLGITPCLAADATVSLSPAIGDTVALRSPVFATSSLVYALQSYQ